MVSTIRLSLLFFFALVFTFPTQTHAQFYNGLNQTFGKNRVQHDDFFWTYYRFDKYEYYFYPDARKVANYAAKTTPKISYDLQKFFDFYLDSKIYFVVYNNIGHFRQSNIGYNEDEESMGGVTQIAGNKVFLYYDGDYEALEAQIKKGIASIIVNQMMYGENWREVLKNSALLSIPDWYTRGIVSYAANPWNVELDNALRDGILSGRFEKFNRLERRDAEVAGHSLWNYIAEVYGESVIPNILYMARVSKNIESGFLFVLGVSLGELIDESLLYYKVRYDTEEENFEDPKAEPEPIRSKRNRVYDQWVVSPDGKYAAFTTNKIGKQKIYVFDREKEKVKKIFRQGYKLDRITDYSYPILTWSPDGKNLAIINEKKSEPFLGLYNVEKKKITWRDIFKIDKVYCANYSSNGDYLALSGMKKGQTDIFTLKLSSNVMTQLTNDVFDDKQPRFINNDSKIIFASNRNSDTLVTNPREDAYNKDVSNWDIFTYDLSAKNDPLERITETPNADEQYPSAIAKNEYVMISDENGIYNRYKAVVDSFITGIDTSIHYRYETKKTPLTNYKRNIKSQDFAPTFEEFGQLMRINGKYKMYAISKDESLNPINYTLSPTKFKEDQFFETELEENIPNVEEVKQEDKIIYTRVKVFEDQQEESFIDIDNYTFEDEKSESEKKQEKQRQVQEELPKNSRFITLKSDQKKKQNTFEVELPQQRNYNLNFVATDIITNVDFDFANQLYQPFNGGPWVNPGMGMVAKVQLFDLFEDYLVEGGMRYAFSSDNTELFASLENRVPRMDRKYSFQRQALTSVGNFSISKVIIHQAKAELRYPFNEVISLRSTFNVRNDRSIALSTDRRTLQEPDTYTNWVGAKLELVFDNVIEKGLNLYNGSRWKIFYERYQEIGRGITDINVFGFDFRHYQKIHRDIIWASRVAGSSSFGNRKLVYYLGGVDNWVVLNQQENPRFNNNTQIAQDQNYYFQALATNMRGFQQNIRNGNNFAVINNELRFPVIKYFAKKPIKSEFWGNLQVIGFSDVGTAWTGQSPFSEENTFNTVEINDGPLTIRLENKKNPIIGSYGFGIRSKIWGYFGRIDYAWGIEDGIILEPRIHLSFGLDF